MTIFRVGSEVGGREAGSALKFAQISMNNVFFFNPDLGSYFRTIKFFALAFRVSGKAKDFNGEGPEFLKKPRGKNFYAVDFTIPKFGGMGFRLMTFVDTSLMVSANVLNFALRKQKSQANCLMSVNCVLILKLEYKKF